MFDALLPALCAAKSLYHTPDTELVPQTCRRQSRTPVPPAPKAVVGELTANELAFYSGRDMYRSHILVAIQGVIYDVSNDRMQYGFSKPYNVYAGCEISRCVRSHSSLFKHTM